MNSNCMKKAKRKLKGLEILCKFSFKKKTANTSDKPQQHQTQPVTQNRKEKLEVH